MRGKESGEDRIQLHSDKYAYILTFSSADGKKCNGTFLCDFTEKAFSSGLKIGEFRRPRLNTPKMEWKERSENTYEQTQILR